MDRHITGKKPTFHRGRSGSNSIRIMLWMVLIASGMWLLMGLQSGDIKPLFHPTPTPTRAAQSYLLEAEAYFASGKIDDPFTDKDAIDTYRLALENDPQNSEAWTQLARMLTYSSNLITTREQRTQRLMEAHQAIDRAKELAPEDSEVLAVRSFVLNWNSYYAPDERTRQRLQTEAIEDAYAAITYDPDNALAMAFYAEIQLDQQKWSEAERYASQAAARDPNSLDTRRIYGKVLEHLGEYEKAIEEYKAAAAINPNLTFLYLQIGVNYRYLGMRFNLPIRYEQALEYFDRAAKINQQNDIRDPLPYIAIAKTYTQMGEFFIAARNAERALSLNPTDANTYGQLGIIYFKSRNYESALPALECAVISCGVLDNLVLERLAAENPHWGVEIVGVQGLPLESAEIAFYYAEYAQVLAYLSRPRENYCSQAYPILEMLRNSPYGRDEVITQIINGSESICRRVDSASMPQE
jgi:tetratricopeptide (TPR) repeat protein